MSTSSDSADASGMTKQPPAGVTVRHPSGEEWVFDSHGWPVWLRIPSGQISYWERDPISGLTTYRISDVNLFLFNVEMLTAGRNVPVPEGWKTRPGRGSHRISAYKYDDRHRMTQETSRFHPGESPAGTRRISLYEYDDLDRMTRETSWFQPDESPGVTHQISAYEYDDSHRVTKLTMSEFHTDNMPDMT